MIVTILRFFELLIFIRCILSWIPARQVYSVMQALDVVLEPIMSPIRRLISAAFGGRQLMLDFSPIVVFLLIEYVIIPLLSRISVF